MIDRIRNVAKAVAGAVGGMAAGNTGMLIYTPEQLAVMPWQAVLISNLVYAGIGFATVYIAPKNAETVK